MNHQTNRYSRHFALPEFSDQSQQKLEHASVLVIGCGGLGHPVLQYLTAAGVGNIGIVDDDVIELSNLHRQVLFTEKDLGQKKTKVALKRLQAMNSGVQLKDYDCRIHAQNILSLIEPYQIIVDCTDNFPARYLLDDACAISSKKLVYAAIYQHEGQVSVFDSKAGFRYRDIFPTPPIAGSIPDCDTGGVLGTLTGIIGNIQANEVIKLITGIGDPLIGRLLMFNIQTYDSTIVHLKKNDDIKSEITELLEDYAEFCRIPDSNKNNQNMKEISISEYKEMLDNREDFQLIDVREPYEFEEFNLGGELIPINTIPENYNKIFRDKKVVIHCRAGSRSAQVIQYLEQTHGFENLYNLSGGVLAWKGH